MFESKIKLRVASDRWDKIREEFSKEEDEDIVYAMIEVYFKNKTLKKNFLNLQNKIESSIKLQKSQEKNLIKLEKEHNKLSKKYADLNQRYRKLIDENKELKNNPIIKEKIVYKENKDVIDALRRKRDELKKKNHNLLLEIEHLKSKNNEFAEKIKEKEKHIQDLQKKNYALLLEIPHPNIEPEVKIIDSKTYYRYKANPEEFKRKMGLNSNFVIKELSYPTT